MTSEANSGKSLFGIRTISHGEKVVYDDSTDAIAARLRAKPVIVNLFTDGPDPVFKHYQLADYLRTSFGPNFHIENKGDIVQLGIQTKDRDSVVNALSKAKLVSYGYGSLPLGDRERRELEDEAVSRPPGSPLREFLRDQRLKRFVSPLSLNRYYDTWLLREAYVQMIPEELRNSENTRQVSLVITGRGIGQMEQGRVHMRGGGSLGNIAVISTTGLVEAPGKPLELEEAEAVQRSMGSSLPRFTDPVKNRELMDIVQEQGLSWEIVDRAIELMFQDQMLSHEDPRINEAIKGMSLSFILFMLGEHGKVAQCSTTDLASGVPDLSKICRLHDAHWQEELLATQIKAPGQPEFCEYHTELFDKLGKE